MNYRCLTLWLKFQIYAYQVYFERDICRKFEKCKITIFSPIEKSAITFAQGCTCLRSSQLQHVAFQLSHAPDLVAFLEAVDFTLVFSIFLDPGFEGLQDFPFAFVLLAFSSLMFSTRLYFVLSLPDILSVLSGVGLVISLSRLLLFLRVFLICFLFSYAKQA